MARNDPQMNLRVPVELKEKIEKAAFENNRTITAEAISRLEQTFKNPLFDEDPEAMSQRLDDAITVIQSQNEIIEIQAQNMMNLKLVIDDLKLTTSQVLELTKKKAP